jgi:cell division GTPase FtsZ
MKRRQFIRRATLSICGSALAWLPDISPASQLTELQQHDMTCVHFPRSDLKGLPGIKIVGFGYSGSDIADKLVKQYHALHQYTESNSNFLYEEISRYSVSLQCQGPLHAEEKVGSNIRNTAEQIIKDVDLLFILTDTGLASSFITSMIAKIAVENDVLTLAIVPESNTKDGKKGGQVMPVIKHLENHVDCLYVTPINIQNESPMVNLGLHSSNDACFKFIKGFVDIIGTKGLFEIDFQDIKAILAEGSQLSVGIAQGKSKNDLLKASQSLVSSNWCLDKVLKRFTGFRFHNS